ncbi:hypothetical protein B6I21_08785 [candidate division KSB1 bacterium 4572_119]|nr:MAG: hypothetical protein B6I21_08785 [candidate division KSB1 bacterium 4572_119]
MKKTKKRFTVPHTLVIIFSIIVLLSILTYLIPGGKYNRIEKNGRTIVQGDTFHYLQNKPQGLDAILLAPFRGFTEAAQIIAFVILVGGAFAVIQKTGAIDGIIRSISAAHSRSIVPISGFFYRVFCWIIITGTAIIFVSRYAAKVKQNPEISPTFNLDKEKRKFYKDHSETLSHSLNKAHLYVLIVFGLALVLLIIGVMRLGWYIPEIAALFFGTAILSGLIGKLNPSTIAESFVEGTKDMMTAVLVIAFARGILVVASDGQIIDTILNALSAQITRFHPIFAGQAMFCVQACINFFIPSGSGQAALTMPIMAPLSDLIGVTRQTAVLAYQFGDGFSNMIIPTSGVTMAVLGMGKIPWEKWAKWLLPLEIIFFLIGLLLLIPPVLFDWGPF